MLTDRLCRAMKIVGASFSPKSWERLVTQAATKHEEYWRTITDGFLSPSKDYPYTGKRPHIQLMEGQMIVDARTILSAETELARLEATIQEFEKLAADDIDSARRARLQSTLETARESVRLKIAKRGQS
jgi:hypothetical protein